MKLAMKVTLPTHVPMRYVFSAVGVLFALQVLEGTSAYTSLAYCAFIVVMSDAFNACGGMVYPSGAAIFFIGLLTVTVGGLVKTVLGEPLDSNVLAPQRTMLVYLVGACSLWVASRINARIRRKKPFLQSLQIRDGFQQAAMGAALIGQFGAILVPTAFLSTFNQLNNFLPLAIMLSVYGTVRKSDGWRSFSVLAFFVSVWFTLFWGIFSFSKAGMFTAPVAWVLAATIAGYWMTTRRFVFVATIAISMSVFLTPISQLGRVYRDDPDAQAKALDLLFHPVRTREEYQVQTDLQLQTSSNSYHWFNEGLGLLDRLTVFPIDDALIHLTDEGHSATIFPIETYVLNMIPRYLVSEKTTLRWGNVYAHEIGMLGANDNTTGISFSPFADAYHCVQWWGVTLVMLPTFLVAFWVMDSFTGSTKQTFWASIYILWLAHGAAEGMMSAPFFVMSVVTFMVILAAFFATYILPLVGGLLIPVRRTILPLSVDPVPRPAPSLGLGPRTIEEKL
ncbi:hypothetical protein [Terriglobus sp. TAA 43]|uniref:hypothetical protein n=1 Tax=Terriglobus sp. TAA 43 TaxID=278961 RepID=UPI001E5835A8|nr:hypothetical protein [Terriglobus sp. TAA 43]